MNMAARSFPDHGMPVGGPRSGQAGRITISSTRPEVSRREPSLVLHVTANDLAAFDVIVATEVSLFRPENAHMRTPKNFRSSRQDFDGAPIDVATGFYIVPTAFLRELAALPAMPEKVYYLAVGYRDRAGDGPGVYSTDPANIGPAMPQVTLAQSLRAANLSAVLGAAVERLGHVAQRHGGVMASRALADGDLPREIGGLPVTIPGQEAPDIGAAGAPGSAMPPERDPHMGMEDQAAGATVTPEPDPAPRAAPEPDPGSGAEAPPPVAAGPPSGGYVDEDEVYGDAGPAMTGDGAEGPMPRFYDDLDSDPGMPPATPSAPPSMNDGFDDYDDGFDDPVPSMPSGAAEPTPDDAGAPAIPPMDAAPATDVSFRPRPARSLSGSGPSDAVITKVIEAVAATESGGRYDAINPDGEFKGRFGRDSPYYNRAHVGLSFGLIQFTQDGGSLGELLDRMRGADVDSFRDALKLTVLPSGDEAQLDLAADALIATTGAAGPRSLDTADGRSARVQPVLGRDLWEDPWIGFFRELGKVEAFNRIQRGLARQRYLDPIVEYARDLGLMTERGLAMLYDRSVQQGVSGGMKFVVNAVGPVDTTAKRAAVLEALGHETLEDFQKAAGIAPDGDWGKRSHAAMVAAIRGLGPESPVEAPAYAEMLNQINGASATRGFASRMAALRASADLSDEALE